MRTRGPSRTATKIARFMLMTDAVPRLAPVLPEGAARTADAVLRRSGSVPERHLDMMRSPRTLRMYEVAERLFGRGQLLWFAVRKRWMHDAAEQAIRDGFRQLLVVGAGFDPLALVIAGRHPDVRCVEIDAPPTAEPKRAGIESAGLQRPNHAVLSVDLASTPLDVALAAHAPWDPRERTMVIAEGLLMYLPADAVAAFFAHVRASTAAGSRLAFSAVGVDAHGRPRVGFGEGVLNRIIQATLALAGERMRWGLSPEAAPAYVEAAGYRVLEQPTLEALRERILAPLGLAQEPLAPYEHLVLAGSEEPPRVKTAAAARLEG